jgi:hypothetical protein
MDRSKWASHEIIMPEIMHRDSDQRIDEKQDELGIKFTSEICSVGLSAFDPLKANLLWILNFDDS